MAKTEQARWAVMAKRTPTAESILSRLKEEVKQLDFLEAEKLVAMLRVYASQVIEKSLGPHGVKKYKLPAPHDFTGRSGKRKRKAMMIAMAKELRDAWLDWRGKDGIAAIINRHFGTTLKWETIKNYVCRKNRSEESP